MSWVGLAVAFVVLPVGLLRGQTAPQLETVSVIDSQESLKVLFDQPMIMAIDLSPDGKQIAWLATGVKAEAPLWLVTLDVSTKRIVASKELGLSIFSNRPAVWSSPNDFHHQVVYSSDQRYLVVQDLRQIRVLDAGTLDVLRTIPVPESATPLIPVSVISAAKSDIFACAFGSENQPGKYTFRAVPVQIEVVDISSGKVLGAWAAEDVPQALSPNGDLIAVSSWQRLHGRVVPLAVFDRNGHKITDLDDGFSFSEGSWFFKIDNPSKPLGRVVGRFVSNQEILLTPDGHTDETGHFSGESIRLVSVTGQQPPQRVAIKHFGPTGNLAISADGTTILVRSLYYPPRILAQHHGQLYGEESKLLVLGRGNPGRNPAREPKLQVESVMPLDAGTELWVSADGSVIAIEKQGITVLRRSARP
jgi:hypothetical protein